MRALGLVSGGLDSRLAVELLREQGVDLVTLHLETGFGKEAYRAAIEPPAERTLDVTKSYLREVVREPRFGYGAGMNACLDCRIFMLRRAAEVAREERCDVVFTGEVLGQRPLEQSRSALARIEGESGLAGRLLRPLSARLLPETEAEREGKIDRRRLERVHGRSRRAQLELAERFGVKGFPTPSGGCCWLADRRFARRLRDRLAHVDGGDLGREEIELLKRGRHFRLAWDLVAVVGRDEAESTWLATHAGGRWSGQTVDGRGAFVLLEGALEGPGLGQAASLVARYSRSGREGEAEVRFRRGEQVLTARAAAAAPDEIERWRL